MAAFGISIPDDIQAEIDEQANRWRSNRSQAIIRIFLEWKEGQYRQQPLPEAEPAELTPASQMKRRGAAPLPGMPKAA